MSQLVKAAKSEINGILSKFRANASYMDRKQVFVDTAYLLYDLRRMTAQTHASYGQFQRYIKKGGKTKKLDPNEFRGVDTNQMRQMLDDYSAMKGPIMSFDFRWFYWMYAVMMAYLFYAGAKLFNQQNSKSKGDAQTLSERREMYDADYEEDVRYQWGGPANAARPGGSPFGTPFNSK